MGTNEFERRRWNDERWVAVWPKLNYGVDFAALHFEVDAAQDVATGDFGRQAADAQTRRGHGAGAV